MSAAGRNEGFRSVDEFTCQAIPAPDVELGEAPGRGVNEGVRVVTEFVIGASQPPLDEARKAELRKLSSPDLIGLVRSGGHALRADDLRFIHDLAIERLLQQVALSSADAAELSCVVMQAAVRRIV